MTGPNEERPREPGGRARPESNGGEETHTDGINPTALPHHREAEESVIGSLLLDGDAFREVAQLIGPGDFYVVQHGIVFAAIAEVIARGSGIDGITVGNLLEKNGDLKRVGGQLELLRLEGLVASAANVVYHAEIVRERAEQRRFIENALRLSRQVANGEIPVEKALRELPHVVELGRGHARGAPTIPLYQPFPVDALPGAIRGFVVSSAAAIGCDPALVALPLLAGLAASIGTSRVICPKAGWTEPAILWPVVVAESGELKTPAQDAALRPLRRRQAEWFRQHEEALKDFEAASLRHELALKNWKQKPGGDPPATPPTPVARRILVSKTTVEALGALLRVNPRGLLVDRDELSGLFESFGAYKQGKGDDAEQFLELHRAGTLLVDRKTGDRPTISVEAAACSICGTIQPGTLRRVLKPKYLESGFGARLLLAMPPPRPRRWTEAVVDPQIEDELDRVYGHLLDLTPVDGKPVVVGMTPEAKKKFIAFYNQHGAVFDSRSGSVRAAWSKLEGYCLRLALLLHLARRAASDPRAGESIDEADIGNAVQLVEWFGREAVRVYAVLAESGADAELRKLVELIGRKGGEITPRDLQHDSTRYSTTGEAAGALQRLVDDGRGVWVEISAGPRGGRPTRAFQLRDAGTGTDKTDTTSSDPTTAPVSSVVSMPPTAADELVFDPGQRSEAPR